MYHIIHLLVLLPFSGFLLSLLFNGTRERSIAMVAYVIMFVSMSLSVVFSIYWLTIGSPVFSFADGSLYAQNGFNFFLDFYFDGIAATYLVVGNIITFMVIAFSRHYMHRESGYKRFFNTILFFNTGYVITILAGNFETLFIGWEILGISSFLLIAFYRLRYLPVRNALKVFTIYRIGDVGILLAMWMSHHLWSENITFQKLHNYELVHEHLSAHTGIGVFVSLMILVAALAKSAQFPFSSWLPRAMEGPTPSSAIFYGSLSVHMGAFLLLRTHPFWEHQVSVKILIVVIGLVTAVLASLMARVQSTIKGQIAYSSVSQIGIIFVEVGLGFETLALIHFAGNAFLRTYQLLISPSAVAYMIRDQFYHHQDTEQKSSASWKSKLNSTFYLLSLKEWNLEIIVFNLFIKPLKKIRVLLGFLTVRNVAFVLFPLYIIGFILAYKNPAAITESRIVIAHICAVLALLMVAKSFNERTSSRLAWMLVVFAHFFVDLAVTFNDHLDLKEATIYLSGIIISGSIGLIALLRIRRIEHHGLGLNRFHGLVKEYPVTAFVFLLSALGVAGFPITTTFFGEDLVLTHIHENQVLLAFFVSVTFIVNGLAVIRIYSRIFLGTHQRSVQHASDLTV
ncbi:MAG TPA: proton-conducting transporter membrane subunit [Flavobacteriales bacterium]|nr:proton-conducting transporter membrane subunit [Flavobacteriales bacterium]HRE95706.1 proton-conducting transporter membrane subunit [Flavobacteriales bacterium]HRJ34897.1 proton-conducting transporter membrane subunit [Flavobacteriales bacterium]HRJ39174.1 proton-conducting transporter membrane subunit [Flavobacteriales bacterium]